MTKQCGAESRSHAEGYIFQKPVAERKWGQLRNTA